MLKTRFRSIELTRVVIITFGSVLLTMCSPSLDADVELTVTDGLYQGKITLHDSSGDTLRSYTTNDSELLLDGEHYKLTGMFCCVENVSEGFYSYSESHITFLDTMAHESFTISQCIPDGQFEYYFDGNELQMTQVDRESRVYFEFYHY